LKINLVFFVALTILLIGFWQISSSSSDRYYADIGNEDSWPHLYGHFLNGPWGDKLTDKAHVSSSGDVTKRYIAPTGKKCSVDISYQNPGVSFEPEYYTLSLEHEDGTCDDSFTIYAENLSSNQLLEVGSYKSLSDMIGVVLTKFETHIPISMAEITPTSTKIRIVFLNTAKDSCGRAAIYNALLEPTAYNDEAITTPPKITDVEVTETVGSTSFEFELGPTKEVPVSYSVKLDLPSKYQYKFREPEDEIDSQYYLMGADGYPLIKSIYQPHNQEIESAQKQCEEEYNQAEECKSNCSGPICEKQCDMVPSICPPIRCYDDESRQVDCYWNGIDMGSRNYSACNTRRISIVIGIFSKLEGKSIEDLRDITVQMGLNDPVYDSIHECIIGTGNHTTSYLSGLSVITTEYNVIFWIDKNAVGLLSAYNFNKEELNRILDSIEIKPSNTTASH
jgi:hypothetical protein